MDVETDQMIETRSGNTLNARTSCFPTVPQYLQKPQCGCWLEDTLGVGDVWAILQSSPGSPLNAVRAVSQTLDVSA